jgi:hypothetical protein
VKALRSFVVAITVAYAFAASAAAQTVVVGTGDPSDDVRSVQAAVDRGGEVILKGQFSFDTAPSKTDGFFLYPGRMVLVSKEVTISGTRDDNGALTTIHGGTIPFLIEAPGSHVTFQKLRFVRPKRAAIAVSTAGGLAITECEFATVEPLRYPASQGANASSIAVAIFLGTVGNPPTPDRPGRPENIYGNVLIANNDIDVGGTAEDNTLGVAIFSTGKSPNQDVDICVCGNNIRNVTERAINVYQIGGRARIEGNVITTGRIVGAAGGVAPDAIHAVGSGSYLIAHNSINTSWSSGAGIRVQGQGWMIQNAIVVDNDVVMSPPDISGFGANSTGIELRGFARGNIVLKNRIRGRARAALAVLAGPGAAVGLPSNNTIAINDHQEFSASLANVLVGAGASNTLVVVSEKRLVEDHGIGTSIVQRSEDSPEPK